MNIGIFGGTFNPPHVGHLVVAERVGEELGMGKILFIPSAVSPHKQHLNLADPVHRMEMVRRAVLDHASFVSSDIEISRGGVSYTIHTLEQLKRMHPGDAFFLLIGMDNLVEFNTWKSPEKIVGLATVVVMTRPGFTPALGEYGKKFILCQVPEIEISSSEIRERVKEGKSIRYLVPRQVESYISDHMLYR